MPFGATWRYAFLSVHQKFAHQEAIICFVCLIPNFFTC